MGFIRFNEDGLLLDKTGRPAHIVGINYVASYICSNFWEDWRPETIEKDLQHIASLGLEAVRIPMHWGYMEPEEGKYNEEFSVKFLAFIEMCRKYDLYIMPWFLVGVATRDYDVPFRGDRPFFTGEMVAVAENHLKHFIEPYRDEEQILFWDICDEPEFYSRHPKAEQLPYDRDTLARWVERMYRAIKSVDSNHLVTLGFGHIAAANYGMDIRDMADILDHMVVTCYPGYPAPEERLDTIRRNYTLAYHVKMNKRGTPVFTCEAPGFSSVMYSEEIIGRYFKVSLYSNLLNGSTGVLPWVYNDFHESIWHEVPLEGYCIEPYFGIVDTKGRLKPSGKELSEYAAFAKKAEVGRYRPRKAETAIVVPEGYYQDIGNTLYKIYTALLLTKGCGIDVDFVWSSEELSDYRMLLMPSGTGMLTSQWDKLRRFVADGGAIYYIYDGSAGLNVYFNELFGVEVQAPEKDYGYDKLWVKEPWGHWKAGDSIELTGARRKDWVRVKAQSAETICELGGDIPALLKNHYGDGRAYLMTLPVDNSLMDVVLEDFVRSESFHMMDAMIQEADITPILRCGDVRIETGCLEDPATGDILAICVNHGGDEVRTRLCLNRSLLPTGAVVTEFYSGKTLEGDALDVWFRAADVRIYKITH